MENSQLTLADMAALKTLIELASERGAFRAPELAGVGSIYNKLSAFLSATQTQLAAQSDAAEPTQPQGE